MKNFIITQKDSLYILWLWDSIKENFEKLAEGPYALCRNFAQEALIGNAADDFRFFGLSREKLFRSPEHCSEVENRNDCLLYKKENRWYLRTDKFSDADQLLGTEDHYNSPLGNGIFYVLFLPEKEYILSFIHKGTSDICQKKYDKPYFTGKEYVIADRNDGYSDIYSYGLPSTKELIEVPYCNKTRIYGYVKKAEAYKLLAEERYISTFKNAYLVFKEHQTAGLFAINQEETKLVAEGKYKTHQWKNIFYLNGKGYPYTYNAVEWDKVFLTPAGKIKNFFKKLF
ncbi:MAG: hypothetical protein IJ479_08720 [Alphaproteobacteria bacterium]|nr:hypothetical protein [Alphaproteobacteria bacterium]